MPSAVRQQAITWANVHPDLCRHMPSLGHNQLMYWILPRSIKTLTFFQSHLSTEIHPYGSCRTQLMPLPSQMTWQHKEPGHQHPQHGPRFSRMFQVQHQKSVLDTQSHATIFQTTTLNLWSRRILQRLEGIAWQIVASYYDVSCDMVCIESMHHDKPN